MTEELLQRINYLSRKSRDQELTAEEKAEQTALRKQYIQEFRQGFENTMDNVYVVDKNGDKKKVQKKK